MQDLAAILPAAVAAMTRELSALSAAGKGKSLAPGDVRKALASFSLFAPCLTRDECVRRESEGIAQDGALEALWPHAGYSKAVQIARRAFINRLGTALTVVCE
jgi:hypothetical protein